VTRECALHCKPEIASNEVGNAKRLRGGELVSNDLHATEALATYTVESDFQDLPSEVVTAVKASMLDGLAVGLAGSVETVGKIITSFIQDLGGTPQSSVIGARFRTAAPHAALANGAMIHALDYDDGLQIFSFHCTSVLLPTVLALGEVRGLSGKGAITAFAFGLEVAAALFRAANRHDYDIGWHRTATIGTLASAAAGAKVLGLDLYQTRNALGIAASQSSGIRQNFGTMTKPFHSGMAARNGVTAAMLAQRGLTADLNILEAKLGFCNVFYGDGNFQPTKIAESLSHPFEYISAIRIKRYPCCGQNTRPVDALLSLIHENDIQAQEVEHVECGVNPSVMNILIHSNPTTGLEGKFSLEFCLAVALLDRKVGLDQFTDDRVNDPLVREMIKKIRKWPDPTVPHSGGKGPTVTVRLRDGREYSRRIDMPEGQPWAPSTKQEQIAKYHDCAKRVLSAEQAEVGLELIQNLEEVEDIRRVMAVISS